MVSREPDQAVRVGPPVVGSGDHGKPAVVRDGRRWQAGNPRPRLQEDRSPRAALPESAQQGVAEPTDTNVSDDRHVLRSLIRQDLSHARVHSVIDDDQVQPLRARQYSQGVTGLLLGCPSSKDHDGRGAVRQRWNPRLSAKKRAVRLEFGLRHRVPRRVLTGEAPGMADERRIASGTEQVDDLVSHGVAVP